MLQLMGCSNEGVIYKLREKYMVTKNKIEVTTKTTKNFKLQHGDVSLDFTLQVDTDKPMKDFLVLLEEAKNRIENHLSKK